MKTWTCLFVGMLLTLGAHVLQGYSSRVCVCVSGSIFLYSNELTKKTYRSPQHCKRLNYNVGVSIKQPLHKATEFASKLLVQLSVIVFALQAHKHIFDVGRDPHVLF